MNTNALIEIPERYKHFRMNITNFATSKDNKRIENNDKGICIYFDDIKNIEPLLFDKDIVIIENESNGTPFTYYVAEIRFCNEVNFELKRLSNYVTINSSTYPIEEKTM